MNNLEPDEKRLITMRTLLTDLFPPQCVSEQTFPRRTKPSPEAMEKAARTFPRRAVLASVDDLLEVRVEGTAIATPGSVSADQRAAVLERGVAICDQAVPANGVCQSPRPSAECKEEEALNV